MPEVCKSAVRKFTHYRVILGVIAFSILITLLILPLSHSPLRVANATTTELFISEYIEGSSNNKAIEIYNETGAPIDLAANGYSIQMFFNGSATAGLTIPLTGTVANGDVFVLAQSLANATILAQADQTNGSGWYNGDDAVVLLKGGTVIDSIGQVGFDPGTEWGTGLVSSADNTLRRMSTVCAGDTNSTNVFDPSVEWDGFATDTFSGLGAHSASCGGPTPTPSPTASPSPTPSPSASPTPRAIHEIQGNGAASPLNGVAVSTTGIVTAKKSNGFFLQEPDATVDADPNTSEGVFVFTSTAPIVSIGDFVSVTGTATEFLTFTEITSSNANVIVITTGNALPVAVELMTTNLDPAGPIDQLEKFESMRVSAASVRSVAPTNDFGEIFTVLNGVARPFREPGIEIGLTVPPDPTSGVVEATIPRWDKNPERIMIDTDGLSGSSVLNVTSNVTLNNIIGPLDFTFGDYKIDAETPPIVASPNMTAVPVRAAAGTEFSVAGFNIENFANNATQRLKAALAIRTVMNLPDVIGTIEIKDVISLQALADQVNNDVVGAGGSNPGYTAYLIPAPLGGDQNVGYLVKTSRVQVDSVTQERGGETYLNPVSGNLELLHDRPPLVLKATVDPASDPHPIIVVVNHLRSFIDIELVGGDGVRVRAKRKAQGESTAGLLQELQTLNSGTPVISVGDYNSYQFNDGYTDPIATIKGMPTADEFVVVDASPDVVNPNFINLTDSLPADQRYSFIFEGTPQALDHVIVNNAANAILQDFKVARMNSDFSRSLLGSNASIPEGNSDHDSPVAYFKFSPSRVVDNLTDDVGLSACTPLPGDCSLRGAISSAIDGDTITFAPNLFLPESPQTILLGGSDIIVSSDVTITGPGADQLTIDAGGASRVLTLTDVTASVSGLTLKGGNGASTLFNTSGGAFLSLNGSVTLDGLRITGNSVTTGAGGGALFGGTGHVIKNSTFDNNHVTGGAFAACGALELTGSVTLTNVTISGNSATGQGGGLCLFSAGVIRNSTITNNQSADHGGGLYAGNIGTLDIGSTIISGNTAPIRPEVSIDSGTPVSSGFNLIGDAAGDAQDTGVSISYLSSDILNMPPLLGPLANNGGSTFTHKPQHGFAGHDKGCAFGSTTDQRAMPRTADWPNIPNSSCDGTDIGAFEILVPTAGGVVVAGRVVSNKGVGLSGVRMTLTDADSNSVEVFTNTAGFYVFEDVTAGETYTLTAQVKFFTFTPQVLMVEDNMEGVNFVGQSNAKRR